MLVYLAHGISQTGSFVIGTFKEATHVRHTCVFVIYNTRLILHDHYTRGEHAPLLRCAFYSSALKKKMVVPHDTELSNYITPVGSVLPSSKKMYPA